MKVQRIKPVKLVPPYRIYGEWGTAVVGTDHQLAAMEAAPDLLDNLIEFLDYAEEFLDFGNSRIGGKEEELRKQIKAVIAKAKGAK